MGASWSRRQEILASAAKPGDNASRPAMSILVDNDARDAAAALGGDDDAFARLYDRHGPVVLSLCRTRLRSVSVAEAEDALQETFIRAHRKLAELHEPAGFRAWIHRIARHVCSEKRRALVRRNHYEGTFAMIATRNAIHEESSPVAEAQRAEQFALLESALDQLDEREQLAIHIHYLESDPVRSAQQALSLSRSGYYKLLQRARNNLAALMREVKVT